MSWKKVLPPLQVASAGATSLKLSAHGGGRWVREGREWESGSGGRVGQGGKVGHEERERGMDTEK